MGQQGLEEQAEATRDPSTVLFSCEAVFCPLLKLRHEIRSSEPLLVPHPPSRAFLQLLANGQQQGVRSESTHQLAQNRDGQWIHKLRLKPRVIRGVNYPRSQASRPHLFRQR